MEGSHTDSGCSSSDIGRRPLRRTPLLWQVLAKDPHHWAMPSPCCYSQAGGTETSGPTPPNSGATNFSQPSSSWTDLHDLNPTSAMEHYGLPFPLPWTCYLIVYFCSCFHFTVLCNLLVKYLCVVYMPVMLLQARFSLYSTCTSPHMWSVQHFGQRGLFLNVLYKYIWLIDWLMCLW